MGKNKHKEGVEGVEGLGWYYYGETGAETITASGVAKVEPRKPKTNCEYCGAQSVDDERGNCACCGAPRAKFEFEYKPLKEAWEYGTTSSEMYTDMSKHDPWGMWSTT